MTFKLTEVTDTAVKATVRLLVAACQDSVFTSTCSHRAKSPANTLWSTLPWTTCWLWTEASCLLIQQRLQTRTSRPPLFLCVGVDCNGVSVVGKKLLTRCLLLDVCCHLLSIHVGHRWQVDKHM
jgi:hypothetical protein